MTRPYYPASRLARRHSRSQAPMLRLLGGTMLAGLLGLAFLASDAHAADPSIRFEGGIGSQVWARNNQTNAVVDNDVFGVRPGGRPWVIERLSADIAADGMAKIDGRGLLLGGGPNVGRSGGVSVKARLICNENNVVTSFHETSVVQLDANGDFRFSEVLNPPMPMACGNPVLLILSAGNNWFAAGIPKR
jgi:hypothetical protein